MLSLEDSLQWRCNYWLFLWKPVICKHVMSFWGLTEKHFSVNVPPCRPIISLVQIRARMRADVRKHHAGSNILFSSAVLYVISFFSFPPTLRRNLQFLINGASLCHLLNKLCCLKSNDVAWTCCKREVCVS